MIDPVLDYDPKSARTFFRSVRAVAQYIDDQKLSISYVTDTHAHANHLTAIPLATIQRIVDIGLNRS